MTEHQLYETNHVTNRTEGIYLPQHNPNFMSLGYGAPALSSVQAPPVSPHFNQEPLVSPGTPGHDLSPMVEAPTSGGSWHSNHHGKTSPNLWGSSPQGEVTDTSNHHRVYPFTVLPHSRSDVSTKLNGSLLQKLDSFSQAFPTQNLRILHRGSCTDESQISGMLLSSPGGTPSDRFPQQLFPHQPQVLNQMAIHNQAQQVGPPQRYQPMEAHQAMHNLHQNRQQFHYGYQQQQQQQQRVSHIEQMQQGFHKQQNQYYLHQQDSQVQQNQLRAHSLALQQQHQLHLQQQRGTYLQQAERDSQDSNQPPQTPPFYHGHNCKGLEQQSFQASQAHSIQPLHQEQQHYQLLSHQDSLCLQQQVQTREDALSLSSKQHNHDDDSHLRCLDKQTSPAMQGFPSPHEESLTGLDYALPRDTVCSPQSHLQNLMPEVNPAVLQTTSRREFQDHLHSPRAQWPQMHSQGDLQEDHVSPYCRTHMEGSIHRQEATTKLRCTVCQREFKSLPALNGHMRSHGGFRAQPPMPKAKEGHTQLSQEMKSSIPIIMPVSVPVKLLPATTTLSLTPQCPQQGSELEDLAEPCPDSPCSPRAQHASNTSGERTQMAKREKKRYRRCLVPLVIPSPSPGLATRGAVLFQSRLRSPSTAGADMSYTPPPMLSPVRPGSGLFSSVNAGPQNMGVQLAQRVLLCKANSVDGGVVGVSPGLGQQPVAVQPQINIGARFQAVIPDMESHSHVENDSHKASLLWTSLNDLDTPDNQQKVDDLVRVACSSVLPGGGTNTEYALHCLFECRGDIVATLERLLMLKPFAHHPFMDYHYAGSDTWTLQEKRQLNKALVLHHKDFYLVQKMVKTKTVLQCVEYYYTWKKRLRLGRRFSVAQAIPVPEREADWQKGMLEQLEQEGMDKNKNQKTCSHVVTASQTEKVLNGNSQIHISPGPLLKPPGERSRPKSAQPFGLSSVKSSPSNSTTSGDTDPTLIFPCKACGKIFFKVKSRNAHMKTHRQQEEAQCWQGQRACSPYGSTPQPPLTLLPCYHVGGVRSLHLGDKEPLGPEDHPMSLSDVVEYMQG